MNYENRQVFYQVYLEEDGDEDITDIPFVLTRKRPGPPRQPRVAQEEEEQEEEEEEAMDISDEDSSDESEDEDY